MVNQGSGVWFRTVFLPSLKLLNENFKITLNLFV